MKEAICPICNLTFKKKKNSQKLCSHSCSVIHTANKTKGQSKPKRKKGKCLNCIVCDKEFYAPLYRVKNGKVKYCSRSCLAKVHLKNYIPIYGFKKSPFPQHKYKYISVDGKRVRLHRFLMEQHLGRKLESWEHVHHINNDPNDNSIENLQVLSNSEHQKIEVKFRLNPNLYSSSLF